MINEINDQLVELEQLLVEMKIRKGALIPVLQATQNIYGYLSKEAMEKIAKELRIPFSEVFGVATFYAQFRLEPQGKHMIRVCSGTACHVRGGESVLGAVEELLGIKKGETTSDFRYTLESVACLGACGLAPVMMIDDDSFGRLTKEKIAQILEQFE
ncbi:NADH-quinone oxidoreductase subunit NuoE [Tepidibacillus marianensis]|uniref:NADH-quinone oxidoreductase subunit NuoE n=1 Tax=Tepidibacillus marianensis TaxID=3131995 RepID=UPI0030D2B068